MSLVLFILCTVYFGADGRHIPFNVHPQTQPSIAVEQDRKQDLRAYREERNHSHDTNIDFRPNSTTNPAHLGNIHNATLGVRGWAYTVVELEQEANGTSSLVKFLSPV